MISKLSSLMVHTTTAIVSWGLIHLLSATACLRRCACICMLPLTSPEPAPTREHVNNDLKLVPSFFLAEHTILKQVLALVSINQLRIRLVNTILN